MNSEQKARDVMRRVWKDWCSVGYDIMDWAGSIATALIGFIVSIGVFLFCGVALGFFALVLLLLMLWNRITWQSAIAAGGIMFGFLLARAAFADVEDRGSICVAQVVYSESRGQPLLGQAAVAQTVFNRMALMPLGVDACDVAQKTGQFLGVEQWHYPRIPRDREAWAVALNISVLIGTRSYRVPPPLGTALYFHLHDKSPPPPVWNGGNFLGTVGNHDFYGP